MPDCRCILGVVIVIYAVQPFSTAEFGDQEGGVMMKLTQEEKLLHKKPHDTEHCPFKVYIYEFPPEYNTKVSDSLARTSLMDRMSWDILNMSSLIPGENPAPMFDWRSTTLDFTDEIIIHRNLAKSNCTTADPSEATFFFLPVYSYYMYWLGMDAPRAPLDRLLLQGDTSIFTSFGIDTRWWDAHGGCDHLIVASRPQASWENGVISHLCGITPIILGKEFFENPNKELLGFVEKRVSDPEVVQRVREAEVGCIDKNVILPYPIRHPILRRGPKADIKFGKRPLLASFVGSVQANGHVRKNLFRSMNAAADCTTYDPGSSRSNITETLDTAASLYANSTFVLVLSGDSLTSARAYTAISMGAIPVFCSFQVASQSRMAEDRRSAVEQRKRQHPELITEGEVVGRRRPLQLAFYNTLDWRKFSVQYVLHTPMKKLGLRSISEETKPAALEFQYDAILQALRKIPDERVVSLQKGVLSVRNSLLYNYEDAEYDLPAETTAFDMVMKELEYRRHYAKTCNRVG
jgi:hypothetical protein